MVLLVTACAQRPTQLTPSQEHVESIIQEISLLPRDGNICLLENGIPNLFVEASRFGAAAPLQRDWLIILYGWLGYGSDWEIFRIDLPDGTVLQLTDNEYNEYFPRVSPDGNWILFEGTDTDGGLFSSQTISSLYVMHPDGTSKTRITDYTVLSTVAWSPNSDAFVVTHEGALLQDDLDINTPPVILLEDDTLEPQTVVAWSPDGDTIAFARSVIRRLNLDIPYPDTSITELVLFDLVTGEVTPLTTISGVIEEIGWSPDGLWIVFSTRFADSNERLTYQIRELGSEFRVVQPCAV